MLSYFSSSDSPFLSNQKLHRRLKWLMPENIERPLLPTSVGEKRLIKQINGTRLLLIDVGMLPLKERAIKLNKHYNCNNKSLGYVFLRW